MQQIFHNTPAIVTRILHENPKPRNAKSRRLPLVTNRRLLGGSGLVADRALRG